MFSSTQICTSLTFSSHSKSSLSSHLSCVLAAPWKISPRSFGWATDWCYRWYLSVPKWCLWSLTAVLWWCFSSAAGTLVTLQWSTSAKLPQEAFCKGIAYWPMPCRTFLSYWKGTSLGGNRFYGFLGLVYVLSDGVAVVDTGRLRDDKQTVGLVLPEVAFVIRVVPVMISIEQLLPKPTLILTVFLESMVSVVSYFSKLLVQIFPIPFLFLFQIPTSSL